MGALLSGVSCLSRSPPIRFPPPDDLFEVFRYVFYNEDPNAFIPRYTLPVKYILIVFEKLPMLNHIDVIFDGKKHVIYMIKAAKDEDIGKFFQTSPLTAYFYYSVQQNPAQILTNRLNHIIDTNQCDIHLVFNCPNRDIRELQGQLWHVGHGLNAATGIEINKPTVCAEELNHITENFPMLTTIWFNTQPPAGFENFPLGYRNAFIFNNAPLTLWQLESMNCQCLVMQNSNFSSSDMNQFLKTWRDSRRPRDLRIFQISNFEKTGELYKELLLQKWDPNKRGRYYPVCTSSHVLDCSRSLDLYTDDGRIGSIYPWGNNGFHLNKWPTQRLVADTNGRVVTLKSDMELMEEEKMNGKRRDVLLHEALAGMKEKKAL